MKTFAFLVVLMLVAVPAWATITVDTDLGNISSSTPTVAEAWQSNQVLNIDGMTFTLTTDIKFQGSGFVIAGENITLNLNGHTLTYGCSAPQGYGSVVDGVVTWGTASVGVWMRPYSEDATWFPRTNMTLPFFSYTSGCSGCTITNTHPTNEAYITQWYDPADSLKANWESPGVMISGGVNNKVLNVTITTHGASSHTIDATASENTEIAYVTSVGPDLVVSRYSFLAAIFMGTTHGGALIHDNVITHSAQGGIRFLGDGNWETSQGWRTSAPNHVYNNRIRDMRTRYANGFAISSYGSPRLVIRDNIIENDGTEGADSTAVNCRGISVEDATADSVIIEGNRVHVRELVTHEFGDAYPGGVPGDATCWQAGASALSLEQTRYTHASHNTFISEGYNLSATSKACAVGLKIVLEGTTDVPTDIYIHDNTFRAEHLGGPYFTAGDDIVDGLTAHGDDERSQFAIALYFGAAAYPEVNNSNVRIENNSFESNHALVYFLYGMNTNVDQWIVKGNSFEFFDGEAQLNHATTSYYYSGSMSGLSFVDNTKGAGVDFMSTYRIGLGAAGNNWWREGYTGTVSLASPASYGVTVTARDVRGDVVATGVTDVNGQAELTLWIGKASTDSTMSAITGDVDVVTYNPYTISAPGYFSKILLAKNGWSTSLDVASGTGVPGGDEPPVVARWALGLAGGAVAQSCSTRFLVSAPSGAEATLQVFDVVGRRVRTVFAGRWTEGERELAWDLRDDAGCRVPGGLYFARLSGDERAFTRRLVVLP